MGCSRLNASIFQQKKRTLLCIFGYFEKCNSVVLIKNSTVSQQKKKLLNIWNGNFSAYSFKLKFVNAV